MQTCSDCGAVKTPDKPRYARGLCHNCYVKRRNRGLEMPPRLPVPTLQERLWSRIEKTEGCWNWTGSVNPKGYGRLSKNGKISLAHRVAWEEVNGPIPDNGPKPHGFIVMHKCDNPRCCNPDHLKLGTQSENVADMDKKGRRVNSIRVGENHPNTKLTADDVRYIRTCKASQDAENAEKFNMSQGGIKQVRLRRTWLHL